MALCDSRVKQFICRAAEHLLLDYVFIENALSQNEDFLRKTVSFMILFVPSALDLGAGLVPCLESVLLPTK